MVVFCLFVFVLLLFLLLILVVVARDPLYSIRYILKTKFVCEPVWPSGKALG